MTQNLREQLRGEIYSVLVKYTNVDLVIEEAIDKLVNEVDEADQEASEDYVEEAFKHDLSTDYNPFQSI